MARVSPSVSRRLLAAALLLVVWWLPFLPPLWELLVPGAPELLSAPGLGVTNASRTQMAILALLSLALLGWRPSRPAGWTMAASAFLGWAVLSSLLGPDPWQSLFFLAGWLAAAAVLLAARRVLRPPYSLRARIMAVHVPLMVAAILCLEPISHTSGEFRATGPFQLAGVLSSWLLMLLPLALQIVLEAERRELPLALASTTCGMVTLALTVSRAAWLVGLGEVALLLLLQAGRPPRALLGWAGFGALGLGALVLLRAHLPGLGLLLGLALLCAVPVLVSLVRGHLSQAAALRVALLATLVVMSLLAVSRAHPEDTLATAAERRMTQLTANDDSAAGRVAFWRAAWQLSVEHPVLGVGPHRFGETYPQAQQYYYFFSDSVHGAWLELVAETGWVGGALLLVALGLLLKSSRPDPWNQPWQRGPLVGLVAGALYAQVEVGYHFAYVWTTAAFMLAAATVEKGGHEEPPPLTFATAAWALPWLLALCWVMPWQRRYDEAVRQIRPEDAYAEALQVSQQFPGWSGPALTALQSALRSDAPIEQLRPLAERALAAAPEDAAAPLLAAEVALREQRYEEARRLYERSLVLDRFNHPGAYHGLLLIARAGGDQALADQVLRQVLATYDLDRWDIAHIAHRTSLARELRPLLYDLADGLSPYREPKVTEPMYRFLMKLEPEPRAMHGLGVSLWTQGKLQQARPLLQRAHDEDSSYPAPP